MSKIFYLSFNDSRNDPTYSGLDDLTVVEVKKPSVSCPTNPCVGDNKIRSCNLIPRSAKDIYMLAEVFGFDVETDSDGQLVLYTGMLKDD